VKLLARRSAFTYKTRENNILVLEAFSFEMPKTKNYLNMLQNFSFEDEKSLLIVPSLDKNLVLSSRNLKNAKVLCVDHVNTYDLLHTKGLLIVEDALPQIVKKLI
jgi:large subunit ribosomal protein L4